MSSLFSLSPRQRPLLGILTLVMIGVLAPRPAAAALTIYTSRAAWESAVSAHYVEDLESEPANFTGPTPYTTAQGWDFTSIGSTVTIQFFEPGIVNSTQTMHFRTNNPVGQMLQVAPPAGTTSLGYGFDYDTAGESWDLRVGGVVVATMPGSTNGFLGFLDTSPVADFVLSSPSAVQGGLDIDNFSGEGIIPAPPVMFGLANSALGSALLGLSSGGGNLTRLCIYNIGSSGKDGVAINAGRVEGISAEMPWDLAGTPQGASFMFQSQGTIAGSPGQSLGHTRMDRTASGMDLTADYSDLGVGTFNVNIYDGSALVTTATGLSNGTVISFSDSSPAATAIKCKTRRKKDVNGNRYKVTVYESGGTGGLFDFLLLAQHYVGDRIELESPSLGPDSVSVDEADILAANVSMLLVLREEIQVFGLDHQGVGDVAFDAQPNRLGILGGSSSSGVDPGAVIDLPDDTHSFSAQWEPLGSAASTPTGTRLSLSATGTVGGMPGQELGHADFEDVGSDLAISADFSNIGSSSRLIQILSGGTIVAQMSGQLGSSVGTVPQWPDGGGKLGQIGTGSTTKCFVGTWNTPVMIAITGGPSAVGDELRILAEGAVSIDALETYGLSPVGLDLYVTEEIPSPPPPPRCSCTTAWGATSVAPPARTYPGTAWDSSRSELVLFGGRNGATDYGDTWVLKEGAWFQKTPAHSPGPRLGAAMAFDSDNDVVVLHGGQVGSTYLSDTWLWDGTDWTEVVGAGGSATRAAGIAYDPLRHVTVMYGGNTASGRSASTWEFDGTTWNLIISVSPPSYRSGHSFTWDAARSRIHMFGGQTPGGVDTNDNWTYDGTWTNLGAGGPSIRLLHKVAADDDCGVLYLYGGESAGTYKQDMWKYDGAWSLVSATSDPGLRGAGAFDLLPDLGLFALLGGSDGTTVQGNTWFYGCTDAVSSTQGPATPPRPEITAATFPNPFARTTRLRFSLTRAARVDVAIFDVAGRLVRTLAQDQPLMSGDHDMDWDGRSGSGSPAGTGIYFYRVGTGSASATGRIVKIGR